MLCLDWPRQVWNVAAAWEWGRKWGATTIAAPPPDEFATLCDCTGNLPKSWACQTPSTLQNLLMVYNSVSQLDFSDNPLNPGFDYCDPLLTPCE